VNTQFLVLLALLFNTVCFSDGGGVPVPANLTTNPATNLANANWGNVSNPGFSAGGTPNH